MLLCPQPFGRIRRAPIIYDNHSWGRIKVFRQPCRHNRPQGLPRVDAAVKPALKSKSPKAKKGYSQNFLIDNAVSQAIAHEAGLVKGDTVFEIGPGTGSLTEQLLAYDVHVVAIEADPRLQEYLEDKYKQAISDGRLELVKGDVTRMDLRSIFGLDTSRRNRHKVVANLPFNITTDVLKLMLPMGDVISNVFVMLQLEAAQRLSGQSPGNSDYRAMSVLVDYYSQAEASMQIGRQAFEPRPNVDCQMVRFALKEPSERLQVPSEEALFRLINVCFGSRRKTLRNNLKSIFPQEEVLSALRELQLPENVRPQELEVEDFVALTRTLSV